MGDPLQFGLDLLIGAALGFFGGLFGVGGGIIAIPVLALLYGLSQHVAQGTAMVMVVPTVLLGFWRYYRSGDINLRYAITLAVTATVTSYLAARVAIGLDNQALRLVFAVFLVVMAVLLVAQIQRAKEPTEATGQHPHWGLSSIVGGIGGVLSGFFGVGGATVAPLMLTKWYGYSQAAAQGLALALVAPGAIVGLATYAAAEVVDWRHGIPLAIGGAFAVSAGVKLAHRLPDRKLRIGFCGLLIVAAAVMAFT